MSRNFKKPIAVSAAPFFEDIFIQEHDVFGDLRFTRKLFVLIAADAGDLCNNRHRRCELFSR
jgi:hypothetical protein